MAEKTTSRVTLSDPGDTALKAMTKLQTADAGSVAQIYMAWLEGMGDLGREAAQFVAERIAEDVKTQHAILHCRNPADLLRIQREFLQKALDQYVAEGGKLVRMSNEILEGAIHKSRQ
ncbi:phasin family protein [Defluviimonas sp. WL0024]|uniref:Phasin family protein n=2 Tax=Albidovulum TaxID=205889 RepID=A0ABT3J9I7_9RHOB|nr:MULTISPECIES: phasin family protein [Defluviimonas]MCU9848924.1 phasin family protein [Defluviimonas sp. WL0024]MCW3784351.1 phasin family protein [Defluviimonas salinarum]